MIDAFLLLAAIYIWPQLNVANKTGVFKVVGSKKIIYRTDNPSYYRNIMLLWRATAIFIGFGSVVLIILKYVVRH